MKTLIVDRCQRIRLPDAKLGQAFDYRVNSNGTITLTPVSRKPRPKRIIAKLVRTGGRMYFQIPSGCKLGAGAIGRAVAEEQRSRS